MDNQNRFSVTPSTTGYTPPRLRGNPYERGVHIRHERVVAKAKAWRLFSWLWTLLGVIGAIGSLIYGYHLPMSGDDTVMLGTYSFLATEILAGSIAWGWHERRTDKIGYVE